MTEEAHARVTVGRERMPVRRAVNGQHQVAADADHHQHNDELDGYHDSVKAGALFDAFDENYREEERNEHGGQIKVRARLNEARVRARTTPTRWGSRHANIERGRT